MEWSTKRLVAICFYVIGCLFYVGANADSTIVNINSRSTNPVIVDLAAGTFSVEPIGTIDGGAYNAWSPWSGTSCSNPDGCQRTSPTTVTGWLTIHSVSSASLSNVLVGGDAVPIINDTYTVDDGFVYPTDIIALAKAQSSVFTLTDMDQVAFFIGDSARFDNRGGMSLRVTRLSSGGFAIDPQSIPTSIVLGEEVTSQFTTFFGEAPYAWSIISGDVPTGMTLGADGVFSGIPSELGSSTFTVQAMDSSGLNTETIVTVEVVLVLPPSDIRIHKTGTTAVPGRTLEYFVVAQNVGQTASGTVRVLEIPQPDFAFEIKSVWPDTNYAFKELVMWEIPSIEPGQLYTMSYRAALSPDVPRGETVIGQAQGTCPACESSDECSSARAFCQVGGCFFWGCNSAESACWEFTRMCAETCASVCPDELHAEDVQTTRVPRDPNEKLIVANSRRLDDGTILSYIQPDQLLTYPIHFENIGDVEAIDVFVTDVLDPNLNDSTLELLTPDGGSYDPSTRTVRWALLGRNLLPGETGNVLMSIKPVPGLPTGTVIRNSAEIQFEIFESLVTPEVVTIIDTTRPSCTVDTLPGETETEAFPVSWGGEDAIGEIESYTVFVSESGGQFSPLLSETKETDTVFAGMNRNTYSFFCVAKDTAGNVEDQDLVAEASTTVVVPPPLLGDLNGDGCVDRSDYDVLMGDVRDGPPNDASYDLNGDGAVNRADVRTLMGLFTNPRGAACN